MLHNGQTVSDLVRGFAFLGEEQVTAVLELAAEVSDWGLYAWDGVVDGAKGADEGPTDGSGGGMMGPCGVATSGDSKSDM